MSNSKSFNATTWDIRVRARNVNKGLVVEKDIVAYLAQLPDLEAQTVKFEELQPALDGIEDEVEESAAEAS